MTTSVHRKRRRLLEANGPLKAKSCECEVPWVDVEVDGERWCVACGRLVPKGRA